MLTTKSFGFPDETFPKKLYDATLLIGDSVSSATTSPPELPITSDVRSTSTFRPATTSSNKGYPGNTGGETD